MRKAKFKKLVALATAAVMALGPVAVQAQTLTESVDGTLGGVGALEAVVDMDVIDIVVPTMPSNQMSFYADPQGLLNKADPYAYKATAGAIYFMNASGSAVSGATYNDGKGYSPYSDTLTVKNKSSKDLDIAVQVAVNSQETGIKVVDRESDLATTTSPAIFMQVSSSAILTTGSAVAEIASGAAAIPAVGKQQLYTVSGVAPVTGPAAIDPNGYEIKTLSVASYDALSAAEKAKYVKGNKNEYAYSYAIKNATDAGIRGASFQITGKCDQASNDESLAAWMAMGNKMLSLSVVWIVAEPGCSDITTSGTVTDKKLVVTVNGLSKLANLNADFYIYADQETATTQGVATKVNKIDGASLAWDIGAEGSETWSVEEGGSLKITLAEDWTQFFKGTSVTVRLMLTNGLYVETDPISVS